jgi:hypothetical protein
VPLFPYNIQNYAYGLTAIPFGSFMLISVLTTLPGLFIYTLMASELARGHYVGVYAETEPRRPRLICPHSGAKIFARRRQIDPDKLQVSHEEK